MSEEKLGPRQTRDEIRRWIGNNPQGVSVLPSNFAKISIEKKWSNLIDVRFIYSGLTALGVVRLKVKENDVIAFPTPASENTQTRS